MQMGVLETMTPLDFLDFRDLLRPASGFQSIQFKMIEATLGLNYDQRYGKAHYLSQLTTVDVDKVKDAEHKRSLLSLLNDWLERMPFVKNEEYWEGFSDTSFWKQYRDAYESSLMGIETPTLWIFDTIFIDDELYPKDRSFSADASRNALFIMLYRDCLLYTSPSPRDGLLSRMPSSA